MTSDALAELARAHRIPTYDYLRFEDGSGTTYPKPDARLAGYVRDMLIAEQGREAFKARGGILARATGTDAEPELVTVDDLAAELAAILTAAPRSARDAEAYSGLIDYVTRSRDREAVRAYLAKAVRVAIRDLPAWRPASASPRPAPRTAAERRAANRERAAADRLEARRDDVQRARAWLLELRGGKPGQHIPARTLYELACRDLEGLSRRAFDTAAESVLGARRRSKAGMFYVLPERLNDAPVDPKPYSPRLPRNERKPMQIADEILDRAARLAWEEQKEVLLAYLAERSDSRADSREEDARLAATGTDGAPVDLAAARERRRARR